MHAARKPTNVRIVAQNFLLTLTNGLTVHMTHRRFPHWMLPAFYFIQKVTNRQRALRTR
jgi:hypothetical protein